MIAAALVLLVALLIPGWFLLALTGLGRARPALSLWLIALGAGVAFYPVLFYGVRSLLPMLTLGPYKSAALLVGMALVAGWLLRARWRSLVRLEPLEWGAVAVFGFTLGTRFYFVRERPVPAWSDSLHHTLLTELTAVQGRLPATLDPYLPIPLDQYHLGLYALTALVQWLAQVPAHTALLVTAQLLNGLAAVGVYLVLDRKVGRVGALVAAVVIGLFSQQPALYANWGRFTQLAGQVLLPIGWLLVWESVEAWTRSPAQTPSPSRRELFGQTALAALVSAGVFLLHFRVAAFYLPLLLLTVTWLLWRVRHDRAALGRGVAAVLWLGAVALLLVLPVLVDALRHYIADRLAAGQAAPSAGPVSAFYEFPLGSFPYLIGIPWWGVGAAMAAALVGGMRRNVVALQVVLWVPLLLALGYAYLLRVPMLNVTNLGAVLILLYLPIGLLVGCAVEEVLRLLRAGAAARWAVVAGMVALGVWAAPQRTQTLEAYRFFVTPADVAAMQWIREQTPSDARFGINTYFWLPNSPHGTDGGYWIPYFTGRATSAGVMINNLAPREVRAAIVAQSRAVERLAGDAGAGIPPDASAVATLRELGVTHLYIGPLGNFAGPGLDPVALAALPGLAEVYAADGVHIFALTDEP